MATSRAVPRSSPQDWGIQANAWKKSEGVRPPARYNFDWWAENKMWETWRVRRYPSVKKKEVLARRFGCCYKSVKNWFDDHNRNYRVRVHVRRSRSTQHDNTSGATSSS